jgi:general secretion pathway protein F
VFALMIFVVPKVVEQFEDVGQQLPLLTRIVIALSDFLATGGGRCDRLVGFGLLLGRALRRTRRCGCASTASCCACRCSAACCATSTPRGWRGRCRRWWRAGCRCSRAEAHHQTVHNRALRKAASADIAEAIRTGGSLSGALRRAAVFPPLLVYLAASGEASGKLDIMLERAADYLEREFDTFTATALSLLEPAIIVIMGAIVA